MIDMLVVGGGYVGLSLGLAVKHAAPHLNVEIVEAAPAEVWKKDQRASAVIAAATQMLTVLGVYLAGEGVVETTAARRGLS